MNVVGRIVCWAFPGFYVWLTKPCPPGHHHYVLAGAAEIACADCGQLLDYRPPCVECRREAGETPSHYIWCRERRREAAKEEKG